MHNELHLLLKITLLNKNSNAGQNTFLIEPNEKITSIKSNFELIVSQISTGIK